LRREAWNLRVRYRQVAGDMMYNAYLASQPPDPAAADNEDALRADLENLLLQIHFAEIVIPHRERRLARLSSLVLQEMLFIALVACLVIVIARDLAFGLS